MPKSGESTPGLTRVSLYFSGLTGRGVGRALRFTKLQNRRHRRIGARSRKEHEGLCFRSALCLRSEFPPPLEWSYPRASLAQNKTPPRGWHKPPEAARLQTSASRRLTQSWPRSARKERSRQFQNR